MAIRPGPSLDTSPVGDRIRIDGDHPAVLLELARACGQVVSSRGLVVRHDGGPHGAGPYGVDSCASGLEREEAQELIRRLQALR